MKTRNQDESASLDGSTISSEPSQCGICDDTIGQSDASLKCDSCCKWICLPCIDGYKKGSCPKKLYDKLCRIEEEEFQWECQHCANMSLPEQLLNSDMFTKTRLIKLGVSETSFENGYGEKIGDCAATCAPYAGNEESRTDFSHGNGSGVRIEDQPVSLPSTMPIANGCEPAMAQLMLKMMEMQKQMMETFLSGTKNQQHNDGQNSAKPPPILSKLPKTQLLTFDGNVLDWPSYWDSFKLNVDSQPGLEDTQKLDYLNQTLKGTARNKIKGLGLEGGNYQEALRILHKEYARPSELKEAQVKKLLHIFPVKENLSNIQEFIDIVQVASTSLKQQGVSIDAVVAYVFSLYEKLPRGVQMKIKEKMFEKEERSEFCSMQEFLNLLSYIKRIHVFDSNDNYKRGQKFESEIKGNSVRNSSFPTTSFVTSSIGNRKKSTLPCAFCESGSHVTTECQTYSEVADRKRVAENKGKCSKCLGSHATSLCKSDMKCYSCGCKGHHSAFCFKKRPVSPVNRTHKSASEGPSKERKTADELQVHLAGPGEEDGIIMSTFSTTARNRVTGDSKKINVCLDTGAKCTCIDRGMARQLNLHPKGEIMLEMARFNSNTLDRIQAELVELELEGENGFKLKLSAYSIADMTPALSIQPLKFDNNTWKKILQYHPKNCPPKTKLNIKIDILVGMDYWYQIMGPVALKIINIRSNLFVHCSPMGNILAGNYLHTKDSNPPKTHIMFSDVQQSDLSNLWKLDVLGICERQDERSKKEEELLKEFAETVQFEEGRYFVRWPWKHTNPTISKNFGVAKSRLQHTINMLLRTSKRQENIKEYNKIIENQLENGVIEKVNSKEADGSVVHYIPHFPHVKEDRATTKVCIVYDASAKTKPHGVSLNDLMFTGKNYLEDLCGILMRFRMNRIAITADIEKAFLQVGLQMQDRDSTRFLWLKDPENLNLQDNLQVCRFTRIPFGVVSSPYLLGATIDHHLKLNPGPLADRIRDNIYMDNIFFGVETSEEGIQLYHDCKELFCKASMNLREWESNNQTFINSLPKVDRAKGENVKVLGVAWNTAEDTINVKIGKETALAGPDTKRKLLQTVAQVFDTLGLVNPLVIKGKVIIQELWKEGLDWDTEIPPKHQKEWTTLKDEISNIPKINFPRLISTNGKPAQLLCFSDASKSAYATVVYQYQDSIENGPNCNLIFSKARVSPIKPLMTIPRLELLGVLSGVRALNFVEKQVTQPIQKKILWTDSMVVLGWIENDKTSDLYVKRRIEEIKNGGDIEFRYISTKENPADIATRGSSYEALLKSTWFNGPKWITDREYPWNYANFAPKEAVRHAITLEVPEESPTMMKMVDTAEVQKNSMKAIPPFGLHIEEYQSLSQLLTETACRQKQHEEKKQLTARHSPSASELKKARRQWIEFVQHDSLENCFRVLAEGKLNQICCQLNLFVDKGLIRCGGRMANAKISKDAKFPVLLPGMHYFTKLVIMDAHEKALHSGPKTTLSEIRKKFWIPQGLARTIAVLKECLQCRRAEGGSFQRPRMGMLPAERLSRSQAFQYVGMDYLGPLRIKHPGKHVPYENRWIALFTCFTTRAVHLELVKDCSTSSAINALTRFVSRRGSPDKILSDNAPQFKCASDHLKRIWGKKVKEEDLQNLLRFFAEKEITWQTIPEGSPWVGGFYERLVGLVKRTIRKVLWNASIDEDRLSTLVTEIEGMLNCRPLLSLSAELGDGGVLTPANFIAPTSRLGSPPSDEDSSDPEYTVKTKVTAETLVKQWRHGQKMLDQFWKIWQNQYLQQLRESHKLYFNRKPGEVQRSPTEGETVLVRSCGPRVSWKLATVQKLLSGNDGETRFVQIRLPNGTVTRRSVGDLVPLETRIGYVNKHQEMLKEMPHIISDFQKKYCTG